MVGAPHPIAYEVRDRVVHLRFLRHILDAEVVGELSRLVSALEEDATLRALVLRLDHVAPRLGPVGRISRSLAERGPDGLSSFTRIEKALAAIERFPRPTVVLVDGPIGSLGLELALVADLTIATPETVFYVQGAEHGFLPGMSLYRLARHIGLGVARHTVLHSPAIPARHAQRLGIVDRIHRHPQRMLRSELPRLLALPPTTLNLARQMLYEAGPMSYDQAYESYKAGQYHALHGLSTRAGADAPRRARPFSAAEYVREPIDCLVDATRRARPRAFGREARARPETDPSSILRRLDRLDIACAVLYPSTLLRAYGQSVGRPLSTVLYHYNDWITDLCAQAPDRLRAAVLLDNGDPAHAALELRRTADVGAVAAVLPLVAHNQERYDGSQYEPLWEAFEATGVPITLHRGTARPLEGQARPFDLELHRVHEHDPVFDEMFDALEGSYARMAIVAMVLAGVFGRHPALRVVTVGFGLAWAAYALMRLDEQYDVRPERAGPGDDGVETTDGADPLDIIAERVGFGFPPGERPSDHFRRNVFVAIDDDAVGLELLDIFGVRNILWAGQVDARGGPGNAEVAARRLSGVSAEERSLVERHNSAQLYGFKADIE